MRRMVLAVAVVFLVLAVAPQAWAAAGKEHVVRIDSAAHSKFGLYYPATYRFALPATGTFTAQFRYSAAEPWTTLPEKRKGELFNGVDAVRFDYLYRLAYVSVKFSRSADTIYIRLLDAAGQPAVVTFDSVARYYDDRRGAVTITLDDWADWSVDNFNTALNYLMSNGFSVTAGIITGETKAAGWAAVQQKLDQYGERLEVASHTMYHSCTQADFAKNGYDAEIIGSRDDIRDNLSYENHPYVPAWMGTCAYSDATISSTLSAGQYLVSRGGTIDLPQGTILAPWDAARGMYGQASATFSTFMYQPSDPNLLKTANALFDQAMSNAGIYTLVDHPLRSPYSAGSSLVQHLNYIKGRGDVWYVPFGHLYQYRFLQEMRGNLTVLPTAAVLSADFTATPVTGPSPLSVSFTDASSGTVSSWLWDFGDSGRSTAQNPVHVYTSGGSYTVRLTVTGPEGSNTKTATGFIAVSLPEYDPPVGSVTINGGAGYAKSAVATLTLAATDASGVAQMCISNSGTCTAWTPFAASRTWTLAAGSGAKTVNVWFRDKLGNANLEPYSASINVDSVPPTNGTLAITPAPGAFTLDWQGFQDSTSGIAKYRLVQGTAGYPLCTATPLYEGSETSYVHSNLISGTSYYYRVCAVDNAGNSSTGAIATQKARAEYTPPTGSVSINGGAQYARSPLVTLALPASDASGVSQVCISNSATCTAWTAYAATKPWTLTTGNGVKTVNVWYRDVLGNANTTPYSASMTVDSTPPSSGSLAISPVPGAFTLNWQGCTDNLSGVAGYKLVVGTGTYPLCSGTPIYSGNNASFVHSGVVTGTTYYYRLCALDNAGNVSSGAIAFRKALAEYDPPTGSVTINGGAPYTRTPGVTLNLAASDASGVAQVCISNSATCTAWTPFAASKPWTLAAGNGVKTVNVWYKDALGNANAAPYTATIMLDSAAPVNGTVSIDAVPGTFTVNWRDFSDPHSGIASYKLVQGTATYPLCTATPLYSGNQTSYVQNGIVLGTTYYYRVCAVDRAGNVSTGATTLKKAVPEYLPPVGSITVNGGAPLTKSALATLTLAASDASGVPQMCISNSATCSAWVPYAAAKSWSLTPGSGVKTVSVWFKDGLGNVNPTPYTASVTLDITPPVNGTLTINPVPGTFTLNWQGFRDPDSGIASYRLVQGTAGYPLCAATPLYSGNQTSYVQGGIVTGANYYYRVCAVDNLGNVSTGAIASRKAVAEYIPPTGSVAINGGAAYTTSPLVSLALAASDDSGVAQVCVSNSAACTLWSAYTATRSWTLPAGYGAKTVNVWFKDTLGNVNALPYTATITLDAVAPTGSVTINDNALSTTNSAVTLTLAATDNSGSVASMQFSNDGVNWSGWEPFAASKAWVLTPGNGLKKVFVRFRDAAGNVSAAYTHGITVSAPL